MLSLSCKAAIKAVVFLGARHASPDRYSIGEVAKGIQENAHTVGKILQKLSKDGIINSAKGPNGGFYITAQQRKKRVIEIVETIDGKEVFKECGLGFDKCSETRPCPFHNDFKKVRELFWHMCHDKRIHELDEDVLSGIAFLRG